ncbi:hypothetical protein RB195_018540 [Necator americanus]|uniref:Reverse transcriptase domain-containing protein n=1 Tax=Necator americanus TaxID=51031 RepID=A0ABR1CD79_NECAM
MRIPSSSASRTLGDASGSITMEEVCFASTETKSTYNSVCATSSISYFSKEIRLRRKLRRQCKKTAKTNGRRERRSLKRRGRRGTCAKVYALLKQYSGKMKKYFPVLNAAKGVVAGKATLPIWREYFKALLNRLAPSAPELEHIHRPTYAVNEEPPTESEVLVCIQKMKNGKSGGDDGINAEMLKYLPPSGIREMTKIIRSI